MSDPRRQSPIAIVGLSALLPGSADVASAWRNIVTGRDLISDVPASHWLIEDYYDANPAAPDKTYARRGGFLPDVEFDPVEFGIPPTIIPATDTAQLLGLIVAQRTLEDAVGDLTKLDRERVSCLLGVTGTQELVGTMNSRLQRPIWVKALREAGLPEEEVQSICERISSNYVPWQESTFPGLLGNVVAGRIANRFDLRGTNTVTDAACASSLAALSMGINELQLGQADLVLAGGVDTMNDIFMHMCFSKTPALSASGDCRPFSDASDGTLLGEGLVMFALKRLEDAEAAGDQIYAVVRGVGTASDGRAKSVYAPLPEGQARALRRAYESAGYGPETVELVEAHGTGTKAGDAAEFEGLGLVFNGSGRPDRQWCALGSIKSQIGHTKAAAGAAGLFKAVMALHHKVLPPTIKIDRPNPSMQLESSPFYLNTQARPWIRDATHPRRASVSSFGFGGSNFHVALEEYVPSSASSAKLPIRQRIRPTELITLSAASPEALLELARALAQRADPLETIARETQLAFRASEPHRLAIVAASRDELNEKLATAVTQIQASPDKSYSAPTATHYGVGGASGRVAFLFPGQGSQYVGMGADLALAFDESRRVWDSAAASAFEGVTVSDFVFPRPVFSEEARKEQATRLSATEWAQPAIGLTSLAVLRVLEKLGLRADCVGGHSFGEVTALHAAGVIDEAGLLRVARRRGELMRDAAAVPGAMSAVAASSADVTRLLGEWKLDVVIANHNAPRQVVISGGTNDVAEAERRFGEQGIAAQRLPVATAFHSSIVAASSTPFGEFLESVAIAQPAMDVWSNAEAQPYPQAAGEIRGRLADQIAKPVRFVDQIESMYAAGVRIFIEVGPSSVLSDLTGRILSGRPHAAVNTDRRGRHGVTSLHEALARLSAEGIALELSRLWSEQPATKAKKKPAMTVRLNGSNAGKPYPPPGGAKDLPAPNPPRATRVEPPPPAEVPRTPAPTSGDETQLAWVRAYQEMQRQTADAHAAYQRAAAESHAAFLRATESSLAALGSLMSGAPLPASILGPPLELIAAPPAIVAPIAPAPVLAVSTGPQTRDIESVLMEIVAEKTGYPISMLGRDMALEADLGIDSIKRVEILSAMRERAPGLGDLNPSDLAKLRTLGQIVDHVRPRGETPTSSAAVKPAAVEARSIDPERLMMEIVAEKTGYPISMLGLQMELEADLGIDSIKRVEILSALRERAPELGTPNATELAKLRTLGQIVGQLRGAEPATIPGTPPPTPSPVPQALDLEKLLMEVVAEKTGYPVSMIGLQMELEADLGIDSIKRVEILSAIRERSPATGQLNATDLAKLKTLGQIVAQLRGGAPVPVKLVPVTATPAVSRYAVVKQPAPPSGLAMAGLWAANHLVITDDETGVAPALVLALRAHGVNAKMVSDVPPEADGVIFLGGLRAVDSIEQGLAIAHEAFLAAKAVAARMTASGGVFVTVQDTGGDFGLSGASDMRAWLAGTAALARTASHEWPKASVKAIDCARGHRTAVEMAAAISDELLHGAGTLDVGLDADGRRTTIATAVEPLTVRTAPKLDAASVVVASGGARGVTAAALIELAKATKAKIALLGRSTLDEEPGYAQGISDEGALKRAIAGYLMMAGEKPRPSDVTARAAAILATREVRTNIAAIEAAGSSVRYLSVNVNDAHAVASSLDDLRRSWGPITAIVHGAGVLADKLIEEKSEEQFTRVFDTKTRGLRALLDATATDPLRMICLFSSVAARVGNSGQCDYAMANEILNAVACAEYIRRPGCIVRSIGWGPWEGGMVTPALKGHFEHQGVALISLATGASMFVDELATDGVPVIVVGDGSLRAARERSIQGELEVSAKSHPELGDHRIGGTAVVPVAMAVEWMIRGAQALEAGFACTGIRNLRVLRGVKLAHFDSAGDRLVVHVRQRQPGAALEAELRSAEGVPHYSAMLEGAPHATIPDAPPVELLRPWTRRQDIYDGRVLFHGEAFRVLRRVEGVARETAAAALVGVIGMEWTAQDWRIDPAALDGVLQTALLWGEEVLGGATLPMSVEAIRIYRPGPVHGVARVVIRAGSVIDARATCEALLTDESGVVAELDGIGLVLRPGEPSHSMPAVA